MITSLHLERFKRFDQLVLPLGGLTVLTGANGAGKTSVIHSLLLARQSALEPKRTAVDLNDSDALSLGEMTDVIHRQSGADNTAIEITERDLTARWVFKASDERSLSATVWEKPEQYRGVLTKAEPGFTYLCAERFGPRDVLPAGSPSGDELGVGVRGEFTAQVLAARDRSKIRPARLAPDSTVKNLLHQTEAWMSSIVRPLQIQPDWFPGTSVTRLLFKTPGIQSEWTRPPNMGFGVSYALPIVVAALRARVESLLVVENPEAHLHPAGQSRIGSFLAQIASDGVQVIIETHSDHVLNGIRTAIGVGRAGLDVNKVAVHFFESEAQSDFVRTLRIEKTGSVSDWPKGFFDQAERDLAQLARIRRPKP